MSGVSARNGGYFPSSVPPPTRSWKEPFSRESIAASGTVVIGDVSPARDARLSFRLKRLVEPSRFRTLRLLLGAAGRSVLSRMAVSVSPDFAPGSGVVRARVAWRTMG